MEFNIKEWQAGYEKMPGRVERSDYTVINYYKNGKLIARITPDSGVPDLKHAEYYDNELFAQKLSKDDLERYAGAFEKVLDEEKFKVAGEKAIRDRADYLKKFKEAAYTELGIPVDHPKGQKLWEIAYQNGMSAGNGLLSVYSELEELSDLIK